MRAHYMLLRNEQIEKVIKQNIRTLNAGGEMLLDCAVKNVTNYQDNTSILLFRIK